jgi:hypothetical protein
VRHKKLINWQKPKGVHPSAARSRSCSGAQALACCSAAGEAASSSSLIEFGPLKQKLLKLATIESLHLLHEAQALGNRPSRGLSLSVFAADQLDS